jgi:hypothetical protein
MAVASPPPMQSAAAQAGPGYLSGLSPLEIEVARLGWLTKKFPDELKRLQYLESIGDHLQRAGSLATRPSLLIARLCGSTGAVEVCERCDRGGDVQRVRGNMERGGYSSLLVCRLIQSSDAFNHSNCSWRCARRRNCGSIFITNLSCGVRRFLRFTISISEALSSPFVTNPTTARKGFDFFNPSPPTNTRPPRL